MQDATPILLLGIDATTLAEIRVLMKGLDGITVVCTEGSFDDGVQLARAQTPSVVMVLMDGDARTALALMEEINRVLPSGQICAVSRDDATENIIKAMRAGATEFLGLPLEHSQVVKVLVKASALRRLNQPAGTAGQIWTLYSPKGGAGTTTTAVNLAVEAHTGLGKSVCLVDLDFQSGDVALALNLTPTYSLVDIALNFRRLDSVFLQGTLTRHSSGIYLLAAPPYGSVESTAIPADHVTAVLDLLRSMYDLVIVDTPRVLSDQTVAALWSATRVLMLIERSLPFLRGYQRTLETFDGIGIPRERVEAIISKHSSSKAAVPLDEAKKNLKLSAAYLLPQDEDTALEAINAGVPLVDVKRNSPLRRSIAELAEALLADTDGEKKTKKRRGLFGGIFSS